MFIKQKRNVLGKKLVDLAQVPHNPRISLQLIVCALPIEQYPYAGGLPFRQYVRSGYQSIAIQLIAARK